MPTLPPPALPVKPEPERPPFRPLNDPPAATYWKDEVGALHILLSGRRKSDSYEVIPLSTDLGGAAFRWFKSGGDSYDVLLHDEHASCTCPGWCYTSGCKHLEMTHELLRLGVLTVAPDTAAVDDECPF